MYTYDNMYEVKGAIGICNNGYESYKSQPGYLHSKYRQWDYIINKICTGCKKPISRYDTLEGYAFCSQCRRILFPETVNRSSSHGKRFSYPS